MSNWKEDGARALPAGCGRGIHHTQLLSWPSTVHRTCTALPYTHHCEADPRTHDTRSHLHHDDDVCALYEMNASAYTEGAGGVHGSVAHEGCMAGAPLRIRMVQERVRSGTRYAPLVSDLCTWRFLTIVLGVECSSVGWWVVGRVSRCRLPSHNRDRMPTETDPIEVAFDVDWLTQAVDCHRPCSHRLRCIDVSSLCRFFYCEAGVRESCVCEIGQYTGAGAHAHGHSGRCIEAHRATVDCLGRQSVDG